MKRTFLLLISLTSLLQIMPAGKHSTVLIPQPGAKNVNVDTRLTIRFNDVPKIGTRGLIRIYESSTDKFVDCLDMSIPAGPTEGTKLPKAPYTSKPYVYDQPRHTNATIKPGTPSGTAAPTSDKYQLNIIGGFTDAFHFYPIIVHENTAEIYLHNNMLEYGKNYYVTIDNGVITLADGSFKGISKKDHWNFTTKQKKPAANVHTLTVSADGSGDFNTVQGAMDFIPDFNTDKWTVFIKNGDYEELVYFRNKNKVRIEGESREGVYIHYPNNEVFNPHPHDVSTNEWKGTFPSRRAPFMMDNCTDMELCNLTVATTCKGQAEGLLIMGERNIVRDVTVIGDGDALQVNGSVYLENCRIEGGGDTVLGRGPAFFKNCTLRSYGPFAWIRNSSANHGNVFVDCTFIGTSPHAVLARTNGTYPHCEMVLIDCTLDNIPPEGWEGIERGPHEYIHYWEFNSLNPDGTLVDISRRTKGSLVLDAKTDSIIIQAYRRPAFVLGWEPGKAE